MSLCSLKKTASPVCMVSNKISGQLSMSFMDKIKLRRPNLEPCDTPLAYTLSYAVCYILIL